MTLREFGAFLLLFAGSSLVLACIARVLKALVG